MASRHRALDRGPYTVHATPSRAIRACTAAEKLVVSVICLFTRKEREKGKKTKQFGKFDQPRTFEIVNTQASNPCPPLGAAAARASTNTGG